MCTIKPPHKGESFFMVSGYGNVPTRYWKLEVTKVTRPRDGRKMVVYTTKNGSFEMSLRTFLKERQLGLITEEDYTKRAAHGAAVLHK